MHSSACQQRVNVWARAVGTTHLRPLACLATQSPKMPEVKGTLHACRCAGEPCNSIDSFGKSLVIQNPVPFFSPQIVFPPGGPARQGLANPISQSVSQLHITREEMIISAPAQVRFLRPQVCMYVCRYQGVRVCRSAGM